MSSNDDRPDYWNDLPPEMQRMLVELGWGNRSWLSDPSPYTTDWQRELHLIGYFGFLSPVGLGPLYAGGVVERTFRAGGFGDAGIYGYAGRELSAQQRAIEYETWAARGWTPGLSAAQLELGRAAYWNFQQGWTPVYDIWSGVKMASYFDPGAWSVRAFGFPFYSGAQKLVAGAVMTPYVQEAMALDPTAQSRVLSYSSFFPFQYQNLQSQLISGLGEWTGIQMAGWAISAMRGGQSFSQFLAKTGGVSLMQAGMGLMIDPLVTMMNRSMAGIPLFTSQQEFWNVMGQEALGIGLTAGGGAWAWRTGAFAPRVSQLMAPFGEAEITHPTIMATRTGAGLLFGTIGLIGGGLAGYEIGGRIGRAYGYEGLGQTAGTLIGEIAGGYAAQYAGQRFAWGLIQRFAAPLEALGTVGGIVGPILSGAGWAGLAAAGISVEEQAFYGTPVGQQAIQQGQQLAQQAGGPLWSWQSPWGGAPITIGGGLQQLYPGQPNAQFYGGGLFMQPNVDPRQSPFYQDTRIPWNFAKQFLYAPEIGMMGQQVGRYLPRSPEAQALYASRSAIGAAYGAAIENMQAYWEMSGVATLSQAATSAWDVEYAAYQSGQVTREQWNQYRAGYYGAKFQGAALGALYRATPYAPGQLEYLQRASFRYNRIGAPGPVMELFHNLSYNPVNRYSGAGVQGLGFTNYPTTLPTVTAASARLPFAVPDVGVEMGWDEYVAARLSNVAPVAGVQGTVGGWGAVLEAEAQAARAPGISGIQMIAGQSAMLSYSLSGFYSGQLTQAELLQNLTSSGIQNRINPTTGIVEVWVNGKWMPTGGRGISTDVSFTAGLTGHLYGLGGGWQGRPTGWKSWDYEQKVAWITAHPGLTRPLAVTGGTYDPVTGTWSGDTRIRSQPIPESDTQRIMRTGGYWWTREADKGNYQAQAYRSTKESPSDTPSWDKLVRPVNLYQTTPPAERDDSGRIEMVTRRVIRELTDGQVLLSGDAGRWHPFQSEEIVDQLSTPLAKRIMDDVSRR